jgi:ML-like domain
MAAGRSPFGFSWLSVLVFFGVLLAFAKVSFASTSQDTQYVEYTNNDGQTVWLADNRRPALYTQNFGDCMGDSLINVTRFDAAYYQDNMTVLFHLAGASALTNQSLMRMLPPLFIAMGSS